MLQRKSVTFLLTLKGFILDRFRAYSYIWLSSGPQTIYSKVHIPVVGILRQQDLKFQASLGYMARPSLNNMD
jgi:hypothetical protein